MKRVLIAAALFAAAIAQAAAQPSLRVGDQKGNARAVMEAAGVLNDVPYKIDWKEFPAAAPLLEALSAGAIETGLVGDAPFTFAAAAKVPVKAIAAIRQTREGLAILVPKGSEIKSFADLKGKKIGTGRGSVGHQLLLAALEKHGLTASDVQLVFLLPSDAKVAYSSGSIDAWSTWEPYVPARQGVGGTTSLREVPNTAEDRRVGQRVVVVQEDDPVAVRGPLEQPVHRERPPPGRAEVRLALDVLDPVVTRGGRLAEAPGARAGGVVHDHQPVGPRPTALHLCQRPFERPRTAVREEQGDDRAGFVAHRHRRRSSR